MKAQLLSYQIHTAVVHPGILCPARPFGKNRNDKQPILGKGLHCNEGCHKNCARWKAFLEQSSQQRREKKRYLDYYNDLCSTIIRQCRSNNPYLSHRAS